VTDALKTTLATRWCLAGRVNAVCVITTSTTACLTVVMLRPASVSNVSTTRRATAASAADPVTLATLPPSPALVTLDYLLTFSRFCFYAFTP